MQGMKRIHKYFTLPAVAVALSLLIFLRGFGKNARADQALHEDVRPAAVALVERKPLVNSITLSGAFRPFQLVDVHAKVAGYISKIYVDVGDKVKEGQVLAILEVPELRAQVLGAEAAIKRSQDAIRRAEGDVNRARSAHEAYHSAYIRLKQASEARPGLIAEQELDDSKAKDKEAEAQVDSAIAAQSEAQNQLSVAQAERAQLAAMESYTHITAPFAGVVTKRYADTGSLIQAGTASNTQSMPVVQLAEWSRLRLVVPVPESAVPDIRLGSLVQVNVSAVHKTFDGRVARFADSLNEETRTMHTEIDVENQKDLLVDGMYAEITLVLQRKDNALTVPIQAVQRSGNTASVLLVNGDGRIEEREVKLGDEGNDRVEITNGLQQNDRVVIGNRGEFRAGERVQPKVMAEASEAQP